LIQIPARKSAPRPTWTQGKPTAAAKTRRRPVKVPESLDARYNAIFARIRASGAACTGPTVFSVAMDDNYVKVDSPELGFMMGNVFVIDAKVQGCITLGRTILAVGAGAVGDVRLKGDRAFVWTIELPETRGVGQ
jgi:hypothetical protein